MDEDEEVSLASKYNKNFRKDELIRTTPTAPMAPTLEDRDKLTSKHYPEPTQHDQEDEDNKSDAIDAVRWDNVHEIATL